jgi:hypothetical protein
MGYKNEVGKTKAILMKNKNERNGKQKKHCIDPSLFIKAALTHQYNHPYRL